MGGGADFAFALIVARTVEILDLVIPLVKMIMQNPTAVCASEQSGKQTAFTTLSWFFARCLTNSLHIFKSRPINNGFMDILEDHNIFRTVLSPLLVFVRT